MAIPGIPERQTVPLPFQSYHLSGAFDEMFSAPGEVRPHYELLRDLLIDLPAGEMRRKIPVYPSRGNHDVPGKGFEERVTSPFYTPTVRWAKAFFLVAVGGIASALLERTLPRAAEATYVLKSSQ